MSLEIIHGDCLEVLPALAAGSVDCVVTDPPYGINFMGKAWDKALPDPAAWRECLRVLKPGGFAAVMCAARSDCTWRLMRDLEEAGFDVGFSFVGWVYATGFPKGLDCGKAFDAEAGAEREVVGPGRYSSHGRSQGILRAGGENARPQLEGRLREAGLDRPETSVPATDLARQWDGWKGGRQALKPALEPIIICQKPGAKRIIDNLREHGVGAFNCRGAAVPFEEGGPTGKWGGEQIGQPGCDGHTMGIGWQQGFRTQQGNGRHPANLLVSDGALNGRSKFFSLDAWAEEHLPAVMDVAKPSRAEKEAGCEGSAERQGGVRNQSGRGLDIICTKCGKRQRGPCKCEEPALGYRDIPTTNPHPTCKPVALMGWLAKLLCPEGGTVLDPFLGSGTTLVAAAKLGLNGIGIEREAEYVEIARKRVARATEQLRLEVSA